MKMTMNEQTKLFEVCDAFGGKLRAINSSQQPRLEMSKETLIAWKQRVFNYQQEAKQLEQPIQTSLFETAPTWDAGFE